MNHIPRVYGLGALVCLLAVTGASCRSIGSRTSVPDPEAFFQSEVRPIFELNCVICHNGHRLPGHLDLTTRTAALAGQLNGRPFLVPMHPDESLLLTAVSRNGTHPKLMPQRDLSLSEEDVGTLREWIEDGAFWPAGPAGRLQARPNPEFPQPPA